MVQGPEEAKAAAAIKDRAKGINFSRQGPCQSDDE